MGIRTQTIDMGIAKYTRSVMDISVDETSGIETGYIEFQNSFLPVWRPYEQSEAEKSGGVWRPVYRISLTRVPNTRKILSQRGKVLVDGREHDLPLAGLEVTYHLKRHLEGA